MQCNEIAKHNMEQVKLIIDKIEKKYLEQTLSKLLINMDL